MSVHFCLNQLPLVRILALCLPVSTHRIHLVLGNVLCVQFCGLTNQVLQNKYVPHPKYRVFVRLLNDYVLPDLYGTLWSLLDGDVNFLARSKSIIFINRCTIENPFSGPPSAFSGDQPTSSPCWSTSTAPRSSSSPNTGQTELLGSAEFASNGLCGRMFSLNDDSPPLHNIINSSLIGSQLLQVPVPVPGII